MAPMQVSRLSHLLENEESKVHCPGLFCISALKKFGTFLLKLDTEEILPMYVKLCRGEICPLWLSGRRLGL